MQHRASSVPRFMDCPSSAAGTDYKIESASDPADEGTAVHEAMAMVVEGKEPDLDAIAMEHSVDRKTLGVLVANGRRAWAVLGEHFPSPRTEVKVESKYIRGTTDVIHADTETLAVNDWKSGWVRRQHVAQVASYAHAAVAQYGMPSSGYVLATITWLRFDEIETLKMDAEFLKGFEDSLIRSEKQIGKTYAPGEEHCGFCPQRLGCKAWQDFQLGAVKSLTVMKDGDVAMPAKMLASLYDDSRALKRALENYEKALKTTVRQEGELGLPDGRTLRFVDTYKQTIEPQKAWPVMTAAGLGKDDIAKCLTVGKTRLLDIVGSKSAPRRKGKDKALIMEQLTEAGAVTESISSRLTPQK